MTKLKLLLKSLLLVAALQTHAQTDTVPIAYRQPLFDADPQVSTFKLEGEQLNNKNRFLRFYLITGYREGIKPTEGFAGFKGKFQNDTLSNTTRLYMMNLSIEDILTQGGRYPSNVVLEVKKPEEYRYDPAYGSYLEWLRKNARCCELLFPAGTLSSLGPIHTMLDSLFNVKTFTEKRMVRTLVLKRSSERDKIKTQGGGSLSDPSTGHFNNVPIAELTQAMLKQMPLLVMDEVGYPGMISINLRITNWHDIQSVQKALERYDLSLTEQMREIEMFIIKENN